MAILKNKRLTYSQTLQTSLHLNVWYFNHLQYIQVSFTDSKQIQNLQLVHLSSSLITLITQTVKLNSGCDLNSSMCSGPHKESQTVCTHAHVCKLTYVSVM